MFAMALPQSLRPKPSGYLAIFCSIPRSQVSFGDKFPSVDLAAVLPNMATLNKYPELLSVGI
jgi:hypothetical protein